MRITKKFAGSSCIGKQSFSPCEKTPENLKTIQDIQDDLNVLQEKFMAKLLGDQRNSSVTASSQPKPQAGPKAGVNKKGEESGIPSDQVYGSGTAANGSHIGVADRANHNNSNSSDAIKKSESNGGNESSSSNTGKPLGMFLSIEGNADPNQQNSVNNNSSSSQCTIQHLARTYEDRIVQREHYQKHHLHLQQQQHQQQQQQQLLLYMQRQQKELNAGHTGHESYEVQDNPSPDHSEDSTSKNSVSSAGSSGSNVHSSIDGCNSERSTSDPDDNDNFDRKSETAFKSVKSGKEGSESWHMSPGMRSSVKNAADVKQQSGSFHLHHANANQNEMKKRSANEAFEYAGDNGSGKFTLNPDSFDKFSKFCSATKKSHYKDESKKKQKKSKSTRSSSSRTHYETAATATAGIDVSQKDLDASDLLLNFFKQSASESPKSGDNDSLESKFKENDNNCGGNSGDDERSESSSNATLPNTMSNQEGISYQLPQSVNQYSEGAEQEQGASV